MSISDYKTLKYRYLEISLTFFKLSRCLKTCFQTTNLCRLEAGFRTGIDDLLPESVFGKKNDSVLKWINKEKLTFVDKEKALIYLYLASPIAAAADKEGLNSAANIIKDFQNPKLPKENFERITDIIVNIDHYGKYSIRCKVHGKDFISEAISPSDARKLARGEMDRMELAEKYYARQLENFREKGKRLKI